MPDIFDIIIIGAGPAGLSAALSALAAKPKPSVLLVDKLVPWERPIACAEGVWTDQFKAAVGEKPEWIRLYISTLVLHSADGSIITHFAKDAGCIINRPRMQKDMTGQCRELGAQLRLNTRVTDVAPEKESLREVCFADGAIVRGRVVIDASGPVAGFGKKEKISWKPLDLEPAYFVVAENTGIAADEVHVYLGSNLAPGGYAWAFPREAGTANVGIVVGSARRAHADIKKKLDVFLGDNFPGAKIVHCHAGGIPCEAKPQVIAVSRFLKAGDAASTVNPFSRAGIVEAMESGKLAGEAALAMLAVISQNQMRAVCKKYQKQWFDTEGKKHGKLSRAKGALVKMPDADYNAAFSSLSKIPPTKRSISKIIGLSLGRFPRLAFAMRHLI
jgi:digeranylgeranylglycerophospholipid reductase